ncbi:MAG: EamA family transporter [Pseudomonadota bacterium]
MKATSRDWILLCCLGLIWGASFMATEIATSEFDVLTLAALRLIIGAGVLVMLLIIRRERLPGFHTRKERGFWLFALGSALATNALPFTLLSFAQRHVDSSFAGVVVSSVPLFVLPMAHFLVPGERMTWRRSIGFGLGFIGIVVLLGTDALFRPIEGPTVILAQLSCVVAAICRASGAIIAKRAPQLGLIRFAAAGLILGSVIAAPIALAVEGVPAMPTSLPGVLATAYLGLIPTALALVMLLSIVASAGPSFLSTVNFQVPLWAVFFGVFLLGEDLPPQLGIALGLTVCGLVLSQGLVGLRRGGHAQG